MRRLRDIGASGTVVCSHEGQGYEGPPALYQGLGFRDHSHTVKYVVRKSDLTLT